MKNRFLLITKNLILYKYMFDLYFYSLKDKLPSNYYLVVKTMKMLNLTHMKCNWTYFMNMLHKLNHNKSIDLHVNIIYKVGHLDIMYDILCFLQVINILFHLNLVHIRNNHHKMAPYNLNNQMDKENTEDLQRWYKFPLGILEYKYH
jgi:hypothetical protein